MLYDKNYNESTKNQIKLNKNKLNIITMACMCASNRYYRFISLLVIASVYFDEHTLGVL